MPEFFRDKTPGPIRQITDMPENGGRIGKDRLPSAGAAGPEIRNSTLLSVTMTPDPGKPITGPFFLRERSGISLGDCFEEPVFPQEGHQYGAAGKKAAAMHRQKKVKKPSNLP